MLNGRVLKQRGVRRQTRATLLGALRCRGSPPDLSFYHPECEIDHAPSARRRTCGEPTSGHGGADRRPAEMEIPRPTGNQAGNKDFPGVNLKLLNMF